MKLHFAVLCSLLFLCSCTLGNQKTLRHIGTYVDSEITFHSFFSDPNKFIINDTHFFYRRDWNTDEYALLDLKKVEIIDERIVPNLKVVIGVYNQYIVFEESEIIHFYDVFNDTVLQLDDIKDSGTFYWIKNNIGDSDRLMKVTFETGEILEVDVPIDMRRMINDSFNLIHQPNSNILTLREANIDYSRFYDLTIDGNIVSTVNESFIEYSYSFRLNESKYIGLVRNENMGEGFYDYYPIVFDLNTNIIEEEYPDIISFGSEPFKDKDVFFLLLNTSQNIALFFDFDRDGTYETDESSTSGFPIRSAIIQCYKLVY